MKIMVLADGETFSMLVGCTIVDVPEELTTDQIEEGLEEILAFNGKVEGFRQVARFNGFGDLCMVDKDNPNADVKSIEIG